jgi:hypothetical protein
MLVPHMSYPRDLDLRILVDVVLLLPFSERLAIRAYGEVLG